MKVQPASGYLILQQRFMAEMTYWFSVLGHYFFLVFYIKDVVMNWMQIKHFHIAVKR